MARTRFSSITENIGVGVHILCVKDIENDDLEEFKKEVYNLIRKLNFLYIFATSKNFEDIQSWVSKEDKTSGKEDYSKVVKVNKVLNDKLLNDFNTSSKVFLISNLKELCGEENPEDLVIDFNLGQYKYLSNKEINFIVEALAGTGKSTTSVARLCHSMIVYGIKPEEICCLTFTNAATDETKDKVSDFLESWAEITKRKEIRRLLDSYKKINIQTIDSFFAKILGAIGYVYGLGNEVKIIRNDFEINKIIDKRVRRFLDNKENYSIIRKIGLYRYELIKIVEDILNSNSYSIEEYLTLDVGNKVKDTIECKKIKELIEDCAINIVEYLHKRMKEESVVKLSELTYLTLKALKENSFSKDYFPVYRYMAVDESQDTSKNQIECLRRLQNIIGYKAVIVGDSNQAIYYWRNADEDAMESLAQGYEKQELSLNYRGKVKTTNYTNKFAENNMKNSFTKKMRCRSNEGDGFVQGFNININDCIKTGSLPDKFVQTLRNELQALDVARACGEIKKGKSNKIAILARTNEQVKYIYESLKNSEEFGSLDTELYGIGSLYRTEAAKDLIILVMYLIDRNNKHNIYDMLWSNYANLRDEAGNRFKYKRSSLWFLSIETYRKIMEPIDRVINGISREGKTAIEYLDLVARKLIRSDVDDYYYNDYQKIMNKLFLSKGINTLVDIKELLFNQLKSNTTDKSTKEERGKVDIIIQTSHTAKGLEYYGVIAVEDFMYEEEFMRFINVIRTNDNVSFQIYLDKKVRGSAKEIIIKTHDYDIFANAQKNKIDKEEKNIAYVTITRCISRLIVFYNEMEKNIGIFFKDMFNKTNNAS